jgi:hypothetical protein
VSKSAPAGGYELLTKPGLPPLAEAASLALAILQSARTARWVDLLRTGPEGPYYELPHEIILTVEQQRTLQQQQHLLGLLQRSTQEILDDDTGEVVSPATQLLTFVVCPACQRWIYLSSASVPSKCIMSADCPGEPVKASAASRRAITGLPALPESLLAEPDDQPQAPTAYNSDEYADF